MKFVFYLAGLFFGLSFNLCCQTNNSLNVYGGEIKSIAIGNDEVNVNNYYFPDDQLKAYLNKLDAKLGEVPKKMKNELVATISVLVGKEYELIDTIDFYKDELLKLRKVIDEIRREKKYIEQEVFMYLNLSSSVVNGTEYLVNQGYDTYASTKKGDQKNGFKIKDLLDDPTQVLIFPPQDGISKIRRYNKYGLIDSRYGHLIRELKYDSIHPFYNSYALFKHNNKIGFIYHNSSDYLDIESIYLDGKDYSNGYAAVSLEKDKWFVIDRKGKRVFDDVFYEIGRVDENKLVIAKKKKNDDYILINLNGERVVQKHYHRIRPLSEGLYAVQLRENSNWGFIDRSEKDVLLPIFSAVNSFKNDRSIVAKKSDIETSKHFWGVINSNGLEIIPILFDSVTIQQGAYVVEAKNYDNKDYSFRLDADGNCISPNKKIYFEVIRSRK